MNEPQSSDDDSTARIRDASRILGTCKTLKIWARLDDPKDLVWREMFDPILSKDCRPAPELASYEGSVPLGKAFVIEDGELRIYIQVDMLGRGRILGGEKLKVLELRLEFSKEAPAPSYDDDEDG
jgi:hypothetical protein